MAKPTPSPVPPAPGTPLPPGVADIPLPPQELWDELAGEGPAPDASAGPAPAAAAAPAAGRPQVARLKFVGGKPREASFDLEQPFEWEGGLVERITVRSLTVAEVDALVDTLPERFNFFEIYAGMCGLPAEVLRGLDDADGTRLAEVARPFFPRRFRVTDAS